jgi:hypothetical protein
MRREMLTKTHHNTDKNETYLRSYERYFAPLKNDNICLLELGVLHGGSLLLWRDYFPNGTIVGVDMNPAEIDDETGRVQVYQGLQQDTSFLDHVRDDAAPDGFDIVIDDASHIGELTRISFWHLLDFHLKPGGIYVIEDWRTGYWDRYPDGKSYGWPKMEGGVRDNMRRLTDSLLVRLGKTSVASGLHRYLIILLEKMRHHIVYKRRFPSHDYGMVGFIKELVDELGMDMITNPARGSKLPQREPKFSRMEICPGQVFVIKNPDANE